MPEFITLADGSLTVKGRNLLKGFTVHVPALMSNNTAVYLRDQDSDLYIRNIMITYGDEDYPYTPAPEIDETVVLT